jgi:U3 small nucleolar RNA-associated protein 12
VYTFSLAHEHDEDMVDIAESISASDEFQLLQTIRLKQKITSFSFCPAEPKKGTLGSIGLALHNNSLEVHELQEESTSRVHSIEISGHRSDVRVAALSTDSTTLMTASHNAVKICVCCCTGLLPYKFRIQSYNIQSSNFGFFGCR